jgi:hypothetical protein
MRKKSHISLARYIVEDLQNEELKKHRFCFYVGSILPDIKPSFLYKRHEMTGTFPTLQKHIRRLSEGMQEDEKKGRKYYIDLGQISHYLADYFTYPHNKIYPGTLKDHCSYEEKLKRDLREYIRSGEVHKKVWNPVNFSNADALCGYIQKAHDDYIRRQHNVEDDIRSIIAVNLNALNGMLRVRELVRAQGNAPRHVGKWS